MFSAKTSCNLRSERVPATAWPPLSVAFLMVGGCSSDSSSPTEGIGVAADAQGIIRVPESSGLRKRLAMQAVDVRDTPHALILPADVDSIVASLKKSSEARIQRAPIIAMLTAQRRKDTRANAFCRRSTARLINLSRDFCKLYGPTT